MYVAEGMDLGLGCHRFREKSGMFWAALVAQQVRNPAMQETQETRVRSLGWEDTLEEGTGNPLRYPWQPTPVSLSGESHEQRSLARYSLEGSKESDTIEAT